MKCLSLLPIAAVVCATAATLPLPPPLLPAPDSPLFQTFDGKPLATPRFLGDETQREKQFRLPVPKQRKQARNTATDVCSIPLAGPTIPMHHADRMAVPAMPSADRNVVPPPAPPCKKELAEGWKPKR
jgi:hypothetical protein